MIADDHSIVRSGLRLLLRSAPGFSVVAEAANGEDAVALAAKHKPDVVIVDISMPAMGGIEATRIIKKNHPEIKVLVLTIHASEEYAEQIVRAGANGYVLKDAHKKEIFAAVRAVASGERYFSKDISDLIISRYLGGPRRSGTPANERAGSDGKLTRREREVLQHIAEGMTNQEVAEKLFLSVRTVSTHRANLMKKLDIHDTAGLVRYAVSAGIITIPSGT